MILVSFIFLNLFIAIILEGFAKASVEQNIRISNHCIDAFNKAWMKYDKSASGMISDKDLMDLVLDITVEELKLFGENKHSEDKNHNILFNFHTNKAITLYTKWQRDMVDNSPEFESFDRNQRLQNQLVKYMKTFKISL